MHTQTFYKEQPLYDYLTKGILLHHAHILNRACILPQFFLIALLLKSMQYYLNIAQNIDTYYKIMY